MKKHKKDLKFLINHQSNAESSKEIGEERCSLIFVNLHMVSLFYRDWCMSYLLLQCERKATWSSAEVIHECCVKRWECWSRGVSGCRGPRFIVFGVGDHVRFTVGWLE